MRLLADLHLERMVVGVSIYRDDLNDRHITVNWQTRVSGVRQVGPHDEVAILAAWSTTKRGTRALTQSGEVWRTLKLAVQWDVRRFGKSVSRLAQGCAQEIIDGA
jgi:hypothetical protein